MGVISCAVYRSATHEPPPGSWITYTEEQAGYGSTQWAVARVKDRRDGHLALRASTLSIQLTAVRLGAGQALIPCYLGDKDKSLVRLTDKIDELDAVHWLIVHRDLRHLPSVRVVMQCVRELFDSERALLEGQCAWR